MTQPASLPLMVEADASTKALANVLKLICTENSALQFQSAQLSEEKARLEIQVRKLEQEKDREEQHVKALEEHLQSLSAPPGAPEEKTDKPGQRTINKSA